MTLPLAPFILGAAEKSGSASTLVGSGEHIYECIHNWGELPPHIQWGETHGVTIDEAGLVYIKHRNNAADPMDAIVVFDPAGQFVRSFGDEYNGGGHSAGAHEGDVARTVAQRPIRFPAAAAAGFRFLRS